MNLEDLIAEPEYQDEASFLEHQRETITNMTDLHQQALANDEDMFADDARTETLLALKQAREEAEGLKCCGNCGHMLTFDGYYECDLSPDVACNTYLNCQLPESRWLRREEQG
jgi:hypothetical protein